MSRWIDSFYNHPFRVPWESILEVIKEIDVDDGTVQTNVKEMARLKKS